MKNFVKLVITVHVFVVSVCVHVLCVCMWERTMCVNVFCGWVFSVYVLCLCVVFICVSCVLHVWMFVFCVSYVYCVLWYECVWFLYMYTHWEWRKGNNTMWMIFALLSSTHRHCWSCQHSIIFWDSKSRQEVSSSMGRFLYCSGS